MAVATDHVANQTNCDARRRREGSGWTTR